MGALGGVVVQLLTFSLELNLSEFHLLSLRLDSLLLIFKLLKLLLKLSFLLLILVVGHGLYSFANGSFFGGLLALIIDLNKCLASLVTVLGCDCLHFLILKVNNISLYKLVGVDCPDIFRRDLHSLNNSRDAEVFRFNERRFLFFSLDVCINVFFWFLYYLK